jgi:uncharacterized protein YfaS (alpha-2-macroglobulin family)
MKLQNYITASILGVSMAVLLATGCAEKTQEKLRVDPKFSTYVNAYTTGVVTKGSNIKIQLTDEYQGDIDYNTPIEKDLFSFSPAIKGDAYWVSRNMIEFRPDQKLESGKEYEVHFDISQVVDVTDEYKDFSFNFRTVTQVGAVYLEGLNTPDVEVAHIQELECKLSLTDVADSNDVRKSIHAYQGDSELPVEWMFTGGLVHRFMVSDIVRGEKESEVRIVFNGSPLGNVETSTETIKVPALGDFRVMDINVIQEPEQYVRVQMSDAIDKVQNLKGLILVRGSSNATYLVDGNFINVYYTNRLTGTHDVVVSAGILNIAKKKLQDGKTIEMVFEGLKPQIKLLNNGVIAPHTPQGVQFPFEAVNINAVDVYVTKIYEDNILQFLQVNNLGGDYQMKRVSQEVYRKTMILDPLGKLNLHRWNNFYIDLSDIVAKDEGAIYSVELRFKKDYSVYGCGGQQPESVLFETDDDDEVFTEWTEAGWDSYDYWYDYDYWDYDEGYSYDYKERNNPCSMSYYNYKTYKANILASDIGIIAKAGGDKEMHVFLNDLLTTDALVGSTVEFYNYQSQLLGSVKTDAQGMCKMKLDEKPYVIVAKNGKQRGYLKLRDGESLSMSKFEVGGTTVQKGVKGFMYADRGVWRPGDSIYLGFILEDKNDVIPANHPVTFKLYNPQNQLVDKQTTTTSLNGVYDFRTATYSEAKTGNYFAKVNIGNRTFNKVLKIETVKPNRLKVYLDFGKKVISNIDGDITGKLSVKWLHGAVAKDLKAKIDMTVNRKYTSFEKFGGYTFDDPLKYFETEDQTIFESKVDDKGEATFSPDIFVGENAPGMLTANFVTKVFEKGGDFSIDRSSVTYSPYVTYVGVKTPKGTMYGNTLETDKKHTFEVATVDAEGKGISASNVNVKIYKVSWKWWWDRYDNNLSSYIARSSTIPVYDQNIKTVNGKGSVDFSVTKPEWGRYLIRVTDPKSGHTTGSVFYADWPYEYRYERTTIENATMLSFSTDKEVYATDETVKVTFPSPDKGKAIIAVETGTKLISKFTVETQKGETSFEFTTTPEMAPNVFVHVTLLQPHANTENDAPIRMYGVAPIAVEDPSTHLKPLIKMKDEIRPETTETITITEANGKPMTYTIAIVDDGLLDLTSFKTPRPWDYFYAKEALGVKTWDLYDDVMGAFATEMNKLLAVGGDAGGEVKKPNKANRFEPMVRYIGPFELKAGATATHQVDVPNYIGSVRVMLVAGQDAKYGTAEKTVPVRSPLMVLGTLPRVLSPTEEVYLPVNVFAMDEKIKDVTIEVETNDLLTIVGSGKSFMKFNAIGDEVENFKLKVNKKIGIARVSIKVKSGSETAKYEIELDIRTPNPSVAEVVEKAIPAGESWSPDIKFTGIEGTNRAAVELTAFPSINLDQRLRYLVRYPHGCVEQTVSSVFPQLALGQLMDMSTDYKIAVDKNIMAGLERLRLFQINNGGLAYWPGNSDASEWGTCYAGHFMIEAEKKGYKLPAGLKSNWLKYQKNQASNYKIHNDSRYYNYYYKDLTQAYRLYTLALAKSPDLGAMNRLRESGTLTVTAKWRLAAAYQLIGQVSVATELIKELETDIPTYREMSYGYGSDIRDEAMILETLILMKDKRAGGLAKRLADRMNSRRYMSTQSTAYCLIAMSKYLENNKTSKLMEFNYTLNGGTVVSKSTKAPMYSDEISASKANNSMTISNTGEGLLYVKLVTEGVPVIGDASVANNNVRMSVRYMNMDRDEISPSQIEQGTDFIAEVYVANEDTRGHLREMTINQLFPSGWEIHNSRMDGFKSTLFNSDYDYRDIRDDRVYTYYSLGKGKSKTYQIQLNATYLGKFYLPTIVTEAMYDEEINAHTAGMWVEVVKQ